MRRRFFTLFAFAVAIIAALVLAGASAHADPPPYVVIVHRDNPHSSLDRIFVSDAFLKKTTRWPNGDVIKPVDRTPDAAVRESFSRAVLKRSVGAVKSYWQQVIFSGRDVPPPEVGKEEDVVQYVTTHKGAVGYVSGGAAMPEGVRAVFLRE